MAINQKQVLSLQQKLSPQQIQMIKLLELPAVQLEQRIKQEIEDNIVLEEEERSAEDEEQPSPADLLRRIPQGGRDTPSYKSRINNFSKDDKQRPVYLTEGRSLQEYLVEQLGYRNLPERDMRLAVYLIGSIDEDGYLRRDLESVADDIAFTMGLETTAGELERLLGIIHELEPAGIGARDLRECLLLQMAQMPVNTRPRRLARKILTSYFDEFVKKHYEKLMARLQISGGRFPRRDRRDPPPVAQARQPLRRGRHGHHALHHSGFHPRLSGRAVQPLAELLQRSRRCASTAAIWR